MAVLCSLILLCGLNEGGKTTGVEASAASPHSWVITEESIHAL